MPFIMQTSSRALSSFDLEIVSVSHHGGLQIPLNAPLTREHPSGGA